MSGERHENPNKVSLTRNGIAQSVVNVILREGSERPDVGPQRGAWPPTFHHWKR